MYGGAQITANGPFVFQNSFIVSNGTITAASFAAIDFGTNGFLYFGIFKPALGQPCQLTTSFCNELQFSVPTPLYDVRSPDITFFPDTTGLQPENKAGLFTFDLSGDQPTFSFDPAPTPLPAALPLFVTGLGALGLLSWRRKRKAAALTA